MSQSRSVFISRDPSAPKLCRVYQSYGGGPVLETAPGHRSLGRQDNKRVFEVVIYRYNSVIDARHFLEMTDEAVNYNTRAASDVLINDGCLEKEDLTGLKKRVGEQAEQGHASVIIKTMF